MNKNIYQFIIRPKESVFTVSADSLEEAMVYLREQMKNERPHDAVFVGMFNTEEFSKSLKLPTMLVETPQVNSLDSMAEMLKNNGYKVEKI